MRSFLAPILLAVLLATGNGCSSTVLVSVPPRVDLKGYGTLGVVDFTSNSGGAGGARATQQLQEQIQAAQPGTRLRPVGGEVRTGQGRLLHGVRDGKVLVKLARTFIDLLPDQLGVSSHDRVDIGTRQTRLDFGVHIRLPVVVRRLCLRKRVA